MELMIKFTEFIVLKMNKKMWDLFRLFNCGSDSWCFIGGHGTSLQDRKFFIYYEGAKKYLPLSFELRRMADNIVYIKI